MEIQKLYTVKEVAAILNMPIQTIYTAIKKGEIKVITVGSKIRIKKEVIDKILEG